MTAAAGKRRRCKEVGGELGVVGGGSGNGGRSSLATFLRRRKEREVRRVCGWVIDGGGGRRMEGLRESLEASTLGFRVFLPLSLDGIPVVGMGLSGPWNSAMVNLAQ
jgi:hypothetical protein